MHMHTFSFRIPENKRKIRRKIYYSTEMDCYSLRVHCFRSSFTLNMLFL